MKKTSRAVKKQEVFLKAVSVMDDYVGSMEQRWKKRMEKNYVHDSFEERQEYCKYIEFFAAVTQLAEKKVGQYPDQTEEKSVKLWKTLQWNNCFDEDYVTNILGESIAFDLPYEHITDMEPLNPYTGLFLYLQAIKKVNVIDLYQKSRSEENGILLNHSYNHSCYGRNVSGLVYYGLRSNASYSTFCYYKDFLDMTSLVCLYVFVNDMADPDNEIIKGYRKPENLNQEKIKQLMHKMFTRIGKSGYIVFYHCVFLYSAMMGFFRNIGKSLSPKELDYALAEKFDVIDSINWLLQQFGGKSMQNIIYENTLNSFAQKGKSIINFGIKKEDGSAEKHDQGTQSQQKKKDVVISLVFVCHKDKRYFPNIQKGICPICHNYMIPGEAGDYLRDDTSDRESDSYKSEPSFFSDDTEAASGFQSNRDIPSHRGAGNCKIRTLHGIVSNIVSNQARRNIVSELYHYIAYGQNFGDGYYQLTINEADTNIPYTAIIYGDFSGSGVMPTEGSEVALEGKFSSHGVFYIRRMTCNGAYCAMVDSDKKDLNDPNNYRRRSSPRGMLALIAIVATIFAIFCVAFIPEVQAFLVTWLSMLILLLLASLFFRQTYFLRRASVLLIGSFVLTLLLYNVGGFGSLLASFFGGMLDVVAVFLIIIAAIFFVIKLL